MRIGVLGTILLVLTAIIGPGQGAQAQGLFSPVIKVNDQAVTRFEVEQRARMLTLFRAPGDPVEMAREQLIEDRLKEGAAKDVGIEIPDDIVDAGMEEFAARANMGTQEMVAALAQAGVDETSFRAFVRSGVTWREVVRAKFSDQVSVSEEDMERAKFALSGSTGVTVLLSEIVLPLTPDRREEVQQLAGQLSEIESIGEFAAAARRYSASPSAENDGRMPWTAITDLPEAIRGVVLALSPGEVTAPLPTEQAIILLQMRDIAETGAPRRQFSEIEYAAYYIDGGRTPSALARAAQVEAQIDTCDDLYGVAYGQPPSVLARETKAPSEIPQDIARELDKLDTGETSVALTRNNGQVLMLLMLCDRTPLVDGEGPSADELTNFIRNRRLDSYGKGYLEQLRAEARIVER